MARIKINQTTVCGKEYFNIELLDVFPDEVYIMGGGYTEQEAMKELKAEAYTYLEYAIMEACENCRFWQDGYCTLRKKETCDGATCDKAEEY